MKSKPLHYILVPFLLCLMASCSLKSMMGPPAVSEGDRVFARAEKRFEQGDFDRALSTYTAFITDFPAQDMVPAALLKIGVIHASRGEYDKARKAYGHLVKAHSDSPYASDGMVEILVTYYQEGLYEEVIARSGDVPENRTPGDYLIRKYAVMGDALLALSRPAQAVDAFLEAYRRSDPPENERLIERMKKALADLSDAELAAMIDRTAHEPVRGYMIFQQCRNVLATGNRDEALDALTRFLLTYSRHPLAAEAERIKSELTSSAYRIERVGCLLPTSGKYEAYGLRAQRGFDLAYNRLMTEHPDLDLSVVYRDTESDPERTRQVVRELADMGVCAIVGPVGTAEEAAEEAQIRGIPIMTLSGKEEITALGDFVFRNFLTREMQVQAVVAYAFEVLGLNNFAILYPEEQYGLDLMNLFWDAVDVYEGEIVGVESYALDKTDFATPIRKLIGMYYPIPQEPSVAADGTVSTSRTHPASIDPQTPVVDFDALFIPDASAKVGLILPQLSFYDVGGVYLLGTNLWHTEELIRMAGGHAQGTVIPDGFFAASEKPQVQRFVREFEATFHETPGFIDAIGYDSAMMIFQVIVDQPLSYTTFRDRLLALREFDGVTGMTSVKESGDVWKELYLLNVEDNRFRELPH
jgi:ABC-type branched-subunit amino acid transport system substrate-binding protein